MKPFDHLVFDLDDTLLDTYRQLIPRASRDACAAMIDAGLKSDVETCLGVWRDYSKTHSRHDLFAHLVSNFGIKASADASLIQARGFDAFYNREVEEDISLFEGAREMLSELKRDYRLHLVTSGKRKTQEKKIRILKIGDFFESISHVDPSQGETKRVAFQAINERTQSNPDRCLSIGNRVDTDISEAKILGWKTAWVKYGEHASMTPREPLEEPDFAIEKITDLRQACRL